jgi:hypothetical protein
MSSQRQGNSELLLTLTEDIPLCLQYINNTKYTFTRSDTTVEYFAVILLFLLFSVNIYKENLKMTVRITELTADSTSISGNK